MDNSNFHRKLLHILYESRLLQQLDQPLILAHENNAHYYLNTCSNNDTMNQIVADELISESEMISIAHMIKVNSPLKVGGSLLKTVREIHRIRMEEAQCKEKSSKDIKERDEHNQNNQTSG